MKGPMVGTDQRDDATTAAALLRLLKEQGDTLRALLDVANRQQQAILHRERADIEATTEEQDELFAELQGLEYDREQLVRESLAAIAAGTMAAGTMAAGTMAAAGSTGAGPSSDAGIDFERLLRTLPEGARRTLTKARDEARSLIVELSAVNETNQQLLAQEIALFDMYMSVLNPDMSAEAYSEPGQARKGSSAAVAFDTRA